MTHLKVTFSILDILSKYGIEYFKIGENIYRSYCPFHHDTSKPNLTIYPHTNSFYCFACGKGGSVIDFISAYNNISKEDALKLILNEISLDEIERNLKAEKSELVPYNLSLLEIISEKMKKNEIEVEKFKEVVDKIWQKAITFNEMKKIICGINGEEK